MTDKERQEAEIAGANRVLKAIERYCTEHAPALYGGSQPVTSIPLHYIRKLVEIIKKQIESEG